jgi:hypothetical protein
VTVTLTTIPPPPSPFATEKAIFNVIGPAMHDLADVFTVMGLALAPLNQVAKLAAVAVYQKVIVDAAGLISEGANAFLGTAVDVSNLFSDISSGFARYIATKGTSFNLISIILSIDALEADQIAVLADKIVKDPPDPNFKTVASPSSFFIPLPAGLSVGPDLSSCLATASNFSNSAALLEAGLTAAERYQGATVAGDSLSAGMQLAAFNDFLQQSQASTQTLSAGLSTCLQAIQTLGVPDSPDLAAEIANVLSKPLDPDVVAALSPTGIDQATLNSLSAVSEGELLVSGFGTNASSVFVNAEATLNSFSGTASPVSEPNSLVVLLGGLSLLLGFRTWTYLRQD